MLHKIPHRITGEIICEGEADTFAAFIELEIKKGTNLSCANLSGADLTDADLSCANLSGANLTDVDLTDADLSFANLSCANLSYANLSYANLAGANLSGAKLAGTNLYDTTGNDKEIKTIQSGTYIINITNKIIQIGCKNHTIKEWFNFDDETISNMDSGALEWWKKWKPILIDIGV